LQQLAAASGVSKSMLSQIERGQVNPTCGAWRALRADFTNLIGGGNPEPGDTIELVGETEMPEIRNRDRSCRLRILSPPTLAGAIEWYELKILPGGALQSEPHSPGTMKHLTALSDALEVTSGAARQALRRGDTARYRADVPHRIANLSAKPARGFLVVISA